MKDYWESKFKNGGTVWHFHPSDSAIIVADLFKKKGFKHILIPGFGYGRNAKTFIEKGFDVTGIEISGSAIDLARANGIKCDIHNGSVSKMPFDNTVYDGIYCYALIHLLNDRERKAFLKSCFSQLAKDGLMIFIVTSVKNSLYGSGKFLSKDRYQIPDGLKVFFYDERSIVKEFGPFGLTAFEEFEEPVKFMKGVDPLKMFSVTCKK